MTCKKCQGNVKMSSSALIRSGANVGTAVAATTAALKNLDEAIVAGKSIKGFDIDSIAKTMKQLPDDQLIDIGKNLNQKTVNRLAKTADGQELLAKMGRSEITTITKLSESMVKKLQFLRNGFTSTVKNLPVGAQKAVDTVRSGLKKGNKVDPKAADDAAKAVTKADPGTAKTADEATEATPAAKDGLKKLGMYTAGGTLVLMLVYNTANPFRAIERALNDVGEVAAGVKEVADSAAGALKDVTKGGFDFLSFITKNAWISGSMSLLCLILIFTFIMTSFLGGGNNRGGGFRGRRLRN